jgi:DNA invertase Pin-like site-specific DNA recombinase
MSIIGYARVSSTGQSLDVQLEKLSGYGCSKIFQEKKSGADDNRLQLKACLEYLREGDKLVITKLDRMARSTNHLTSIAADLQKRGIELIVLDQSIDTSTPTGKLLFNVLASIAEFENGIRKERQTDGISKALEKGVKFGPKAKLTDDKIAELKAKRESGIMIKDLMKEYGLSKASIYRLLSDDSEG